MNGSNEVCHASTLDALPVAVSSVRGGKQASSAQSGSDADPEDILRLEKSYFPLRQNSAKKQRTMYDIFVKK